MGATIYLSMPVRTRHCPDPEHDGPPMVPLASFWRDVSKPGGYKLRCIECCMRTRAEKQARIDAGEDPEEIALEERKELSARAKKMHAEGRLGGPEYGRLGGRPRKIKIADAVLDHFRQDSKLELVIRAFEGGMRSNNKNIRLAAAKEIVSMESRDEDLKAKLRGQGKRPEDMTPDELNELISQFLVAQIEAGEVQMSADILLPASAVQEMA